MQNEFLKNAKKREKYSKVPLHITKDFEVWNQPVFSYDSQVYGVREKASEGAARGTVKEIDIIILTTGNDVSTI